MVHDRSDNDHEFPEQDSMVKLHPIVLLTMTDYIGRHTLQKKQDPILGAILGQRNEHGCTMEVAFEFRLHNDSRKPQVPFDSAWFDTRLNLFKEVHASPQLELVGIFLMASASAIDLNLIPIIQYFHEKYNESIRLVLFHSDVILNGSLHGSQLPISIYEPFGMSNSRISNTMQSNMLTLGPNLEFQQVDYTLGSYEAELIGIDHVSKGPANANLYAIGLHEKESTTKPINKGKTTNSPDTISAEDVLSTEDRELLSAMNTKSNAVKMLHRRIKLLHTYLSSLPPSYLTDANISPSLSTEQYQHHDNALIRQIHALISRLHLLSPPDSPSQSTSQNTSDMALLSLLSSLTNTITNTTDLSAKAAIIIKSKSDPKAVSSGTSNVFGNSNTGGMLGMNKESGDKSGLHAGITSGGHSGGGHRKALSASVDPGFDSGQDVGDSEAF